MSTGLGASSRILGEAERWGLQLHRACEIPCCPKHQKDESRSQALLAEIKTDSA